MRDCPGSYISWGLRSYRKEKDYRPYTFKKYKFPYIDFHTIRGIIREYFLQSILIVLDFRRG